MVRYLFYTIGDLTYQSPLVYNSQGLIFIQIEHLQKGFEFRTIVFMKITIS